MYFADLRHLKSMKVSMYNYARGGNITLRPINGVYMMSNSTCMVLNTVELHERLWTEFADVDHCDLR